MRGTLRRARFWLPLLVLCAAVVSTTAAQATTAKVRFINVQTPNSDPSQGPVTATFTSAKFTFSTNVKTTAVVNTGTDKTYTIGTPDRLKTKHVVTVRGLAPNTRYYAQLVATSKDGKSTKKLWMSFKTAAPGSMPATVTSRGNKLLLNGQPWFPILAESYSCPDKSVVAADMSMGFSVLTGPSVCSNDPAQADQDVPNLHTALAGQAWYFTSRRDGDGDASRLKGLQEYLAFPTVKDAPALNMGSCNPPSFNKYINQYYKMTAHQASLSPIIFSKIVTEYGTSTTDLSCLDGPSLEATLWAVTDAGVRAVRLRTQPLFDATLGVKVTPGVQQAVNLFAKRLATLEPAVLIGKPAKVVLADSSHVKASAWVYGGNIYVVAVNTWPEAITQVIGLPTTATSAAAFWEGRTVKMAQGKLSDKFAPMAVHIYKVAMKK